MTRRLAALTLLLLVAVAGVLAFGSIGGRSASDDLADEPTTTAAPAKSVDAVIADVEAFVARTRGLEFKRKVPVTLLDGAQFKARLLQDAAEQRADIEVDGRVLKALGLIEPDVDLYDVLQRFIGDAVVGFYDTDTHELVVRGGKLTPYARATLAHELTHALDDQWFDLDRPELDTGGRDEEALAFAGLVEGNAVRVEAAYRKALSSAERVQASLEEAQLAGKVDLEGVPRVVPQIIGFPYVAGPPFVRALVEAGGERRVDAAFKVPPTTSEDIIDPQGWLAGRTPVEIPAPTAEGKVLDQGVYGQSTLAVTLEPVIGTSEADRAADGWGGDRYVAWDAGGGRTCVRATFAMDTVGDLGELTSALRTWAAEEGATVTRQATTVGFTACR
ncbi:MAG: hypothetical protein JWN29_2377 [Acidimicrobiales bacterium]|nr:hypothetical protein [Acidimicrobiales bacterium]